MGLASMFTFAVNAQTVLKINKPINPKNKQTISVSEKKKRNQPTIVAKNDNGGMFDVNQILATMQCNTQYTAGTTFDLQLVLELTNTNPEYGDGLTITFPSSVTINSTTNTPVLGPDDGVSSSDGPEAYNGITGQTISWGNDDNYYGGIVPSGDPNGPGTYPISINITVAPGTTGPILCNYHVDGDQFNTAQDFDGTFTILEAGAPVVDMQTKLIGVITNTATLDVAGANNCGLTTHFIVSQIHNLGTQTESNIAINYMLNGVPSSPSTYTGSIAPGDSAYAFFPMPGDFSANNIYTIKAWTDATSETDRNNDTASITIVNSNPVALTSTTYTNGIQTAYDFASITQSWAGLGIGFSNQTTHAHTGGVALYWTLNTNIGATPGTYETMNILPCMDVTSGDTYRISFWKKSATSGTLTVNGQTGVFSGLTNDISSMTDVLSAYAALTPTSASGPLGWTKDSVDYVAASTETRYFAIGGKGVIASSADQINVRLDDIKIEKIITTGIKNNTLTTVTLFPNPSTGLLNINNVEAISTIEVYNVIGDKVYSSKLDKGNNSIDLSNLANGSYFVKINSNNNVTTKKVVISK